VLGLRAAGRLGKSLDASVTVKAPAGSPQATALARHSALLPELFIVSQVAVGAPDGNEVAVEVRPCGELALSRCPRCWRWVSAPADGGTADATCPRCTEALAHRSA